MTHPPTSPAPSVRRRRLRRLALLIVLLYLGSGIMLMALENRLVYHPSRAEDFWADPPSPRIRDLELTSADGTRIHAWWCPTEGWKPEDGAVLFCHGNSGNVSSWVRTATRWEKGPLRQATLLFDYPGYGRSGGSPTEQGCYNAADAAYDWLTREAGVPPERILLHGVSLGGGVATDLASRRPHRALILVATFTSIRDVAARLFPWLPIRWMVRTGFDNLAKIGQCSGPVFIAHGTEDRLILMEQSQRLYTAAQGPREFLTLLGNRHADPPGPEWDVALARFLEKVEKR